MVEIGMLVFRPWQLGSGSDRSRPSAGSFFSGLLTDLQLSCRTRLLRPDTLYSPHSYYSAASMMKAN